MAWLIKTDQSLVKEYQRYRKMVRDLNHKIIDAYLNESILEEAKRMLKLGKKRQLILDSEDDLNVLIDFALFDVPQGDGKNLVERYAEEKEGANAIERELLIAMVRAQTGLYKVSQVLQDKRQIKLDNLITPEMPAILTDINLSQTLIDELVIFFRPISMANFTMTSGTAFVFPAERTQELVARWNRLDSKGDAERYVWFFRSSKQSGIETRYI